MDIKKWIQRTFFFRLFKESKLLFLFILFLCVGQYHFTNNLQIGSFPWYYWAMYSSEEKVPDYVNQFIIHIDGEPFDYLTLDYWGGIGVYKTINEYKKFLDNGSFDTKANSVEEKTEFLPEKIKSFVRYKLLNKPFEVYSYPSWLHQYLEKKLGRKIRKIEVYNNWYAYTDRKFEFSGGGDIFLSYESGNE